MVSLNYQGKWEMQFYLGTLPPSKYMKLHLEGAKGRWILGKQLTDSTKATNNKKDQMKKQTNQLEQEKYSLQG